MCSHKSITWDITDNSVTDRMIDNSLIHKFRSSYKIRKRTKVLNAEIKKHWKVKDYKHYLELKTNVLRNLAEDADTGNSSSLADVDYNGIYSSPSKWAMYMAKNSGRYIFTSEEDYESYEGKHTKRDKKDKDKSTERRVQMRKSPQIKYTTVSEKCIDVGWQAVLKKSSNISHLRKSVCTNTSNNEGNILEDNDCFKAQSSRQSLSPRFDSQNSTACNIMKSGNKYTKQDHRDTDGINNELSSEDNATSNKTKPVSETKPERKVQNHKNQCMSINESNIKLNSHNSHYQSSPSQSTNLENNNDSDNELNTLNELEDNKLTAVTNKSSVNTKNYDNTYVSYKPELLKNVRRNLIPALEKADSMNNDEDIKVDKSVKDKLNYDQLLPAVASLSRHSTPLKKTQTNMSNNEIKDLSPDASSLDQQKDSGIDEDSQDRFDKIKESNKIPINQNMKENAEEALEKPISSQPKKIDEVVETTEHCKKDVKNTHLKSNILEEQISKEEKEKEMKNSTQLNQIDMNIEINQEDKEDEHFIIAKDSNNIQKQQLLSPKQDCTKDVHSEFCNHIQKEEDDREVKKPFEKEEVSLQLSKVDKDAKMYLNQKDKACVKSEDMHDIRKQQLLPKVMCTEILNKRYKIIPKKDNDVESNIEKINNNTDIANSLIHCPDVINHNTDNWQEAMVNEEEIDIPVALETDEEDDLSYVSPQTKKRLQQQARLNLVVNSDSSESNDKYVTTKTSREHIDSSDINHCSEHDRLKNDEANCASKQTKTDISHSEDICEDVSIRKEATSVPVKIVKLDSINTKEGITKKAESLTRCTYKTNDLFQSTNKNPLKETQYCKNVYNSDQSEDIESIHLRFSENNLSSNSEEFINQFRRHKQSSLLDKEKMCSKSNQNEEIISSELETRHRSEDEQNVQASTKCSNTHLNISQYRPYNLQELVEDQELLVETMPASFTLDDLSEDEEAFILNIPSKVVQSNLQGQLLTLKEKSIKFNESKYRIVSKEVGTTSCIFATGKKRKPYKIINIKNVSTITIREKLPRSRKSDTSNSYSTVSSVSKPIKKNNRQIDETESKMLKVSNQRAKKRKRRESSDFETRSVLKDD